MSAAADLLLAKLDGVRATGPCRSLALCPVPAHDDRTPSLSVRELDDGRILLHCFGGCSVEDVLAAIGLELDDLFPDKLNERGPPERRPFPAADVLRAVSFEALVAGIILARLGAGHPLTEDDRHRAFLACERLIAAADLALPPRDRRRAHLEAKRIADTSPEEAAA
jgi:hypothetical protein